MTNTALAITLSAAVPCLGRKADGAGCRTLTRRTVEVAGRQHPACSHHAAQVAAAQVDAESRRRAAAGEPVTTVDELAEAVAALETVDELLARVRAEHPRVDARLTRDERRAEHEAAARARAATVDAIMLGEATVRPAPEPETITAAELVPGDLVVDEHGARKFAAFDVHRIDDRVRVWPALADTDAGWPEHLTFEASDRLLVVRRSRP